MQIPASENKHLSKADSATCDLTEHQVKLTVDVLLINLGTPTKPTTKEVRIYLRQFLSDTRIIEVPKILWWFILHLFILPLRAKKSAARYKQIWGDTGSPLMSISKQIANKLRDELSYNNPNINIKLHLGMRYGKPDVETALNELDTDSTPINNLIVLPLYPQYCAATTGSSFDALSAALQKQRYIPQLNFINGYHQQPLYIQAICNSITTHIEQHPNTDYIIMSYHGMPEKTKQLGDPYYASCLQTSSLVKQGLPNIFPQISTGFQSKFGGTKWLEPAVKDLLIDAINNGYKNICIICPGFATDCIETLEEINIEYKKFFITHGGIELKLIPCLNASTAQIKLLSKLITEQINKLQ